MIGRQTLLCLLFCIAVWVAPAAKATEFWLDGLTPVQAGPPDYMGLFEPGAAWQQGAARLSVLKISAGTVLLGPDEMLHAIFDTMHRKHAAMAIEMGAVLQQNTETCGGGEGYMQPGVVQRIGSRLRSLGLTLEYMAMDSPVWLGHERSWGVDRGRPDCHYSLVETARRAAQTVAMMQRLFPGIRVGQIDAVNSRIDPAQVLGDYAAFAQMMRAATGQTLAFFHCDVAWQFPGWQRIVMALRQQTRAAGLRFGIIVGGSPEDATDAQWVADGLQRLSVLSSDAMRPDDVIVQSWQRRPTRMLPESLPGTSTYLLANAEQILP